MKIKLCGLRRPEDIMMANEFLPDYVGFVFAPGRRQVTPQQAAALRQRLDASIRTVGVLVNASVEDAAIAARTARLDVLQLHGDEDAEYTGRLKALLPGVEIWRAVRVRNVQSILQACVYPAERLVLDAFSPAAYGGTGKQADWATVTAAKPEITKPFFLAGGLCAQNIVQAAHLGPEGLDVSSGVETDGCKDREKIRLLFETLRSAGFSVDMTTPGEKTASELERKGEL